MYYKIGTLAKRFRSSPQTIRYYAKLGFLKVDRREQSTTRYSNWLKDGNHNMQNKLNFVWRMRPIEKVY